MSFQGRVVQELVSLCSEGDFTEEKIAESAMRAGYKRQFPGASWMLDRTLVSAVNEAKRILSKNAADKNSEWAE